MSEKQDGSMKIVEDKDVWDRNRENREAFFEKTVIDSGSVFSAGLVHGGNSEIVSHGGRKVISGTDALATKEKGIFLSITVADCVPVFLFDPINSIIAIAHAGWKGTVGNVLENTLENISKLGGSIEELHVALGPGIDVCHFEIRKDVLKEFSGHEEFIMKKEGKMFVDLKGIITKKLLLAGVAGRNIENDPACTYCNENLFSYRRDRVGSMVAVIGIMPE
ncbi:MAG: peptidoglycan editing factor PgeF [Candidatus Moranbacteria bacterium]|nr:peptidoglycan editing factor PgeF [Candidatus Moranbacteria bacterium]